MFLICHMTSCDNVIDGHVTLWVGALNPKSPLPNLMVFLALWKCRYNGRFFCHVTSRDHMIKRECDLVMGSSAFYVANVPSFMVMGRVEVELCFLLFQVTARGHNIKLICDLLKASFSVWITTVTFLVLWKSRYIVFYFITWYHVTKWSNWHATP